MTLNPTDKKARSGIWLLTALAIATVVVVALLWLERGETGPPPEPVLTTDAKTYTRHLKLSNVDMKATDNALGQTLVEVLGSITNTGDRVVAHVELTCLFYDINGLEIMRERVPIVRQKDGALSPGDTRKFRLPFDSIPDGWTQTLPRFIIAQVMFRE